MDNFCWDFRVQCKLYERKIQCGCRCRLFKYNSGAQADLICFLYTWRFLNMDNFCRGLYLNKKKLITDFITEETFKHCPLLSSIVVNDCAVY